MWIEEIASMYHIHRETVCFIDKMARLYPYRLQANANIEFSFNKKFFDMDLSINVMHIDWIINFWEMWMIWFFSIPSNLSPHCTGQTTGRSPKLIINRYENVSTAYPSNLSIVGSFLNHEIPILNCSHQLCNNNKIQTPHPQLPRLASQPVIYFFIESKLIAKNWIFPAWAQVSNHNKSPHK